MTIPRVRRATLDECAGIEGAVVVIDYSWGNEQGIEFHAEAVYHGTLANFLRAWFPQGRIE